MDAVCRILKLVTDQISRLEDQVDIHIMGLFKDLKKIMISNAEALESHSVKIKALEDSQATQVSLIRQLVNTDHHLSLIVHNVAIDVMENSSKLDNLVKFLNEKLMIDLDNTDIKYAVRIGKLNGERNRPIKVMVSSTYIKEKILRNVSKLKGSGYNISLFYSKELREKRKLLLPIMFKNRQEGRYAVLRYDKLFVNGKMVIVPDLDMIPSTTSSSDQDNSSTNRKNISCPTISPTISRKKRPFSKKKKKPT